MFKRLFSLFRREPVRAPLPVSVSVPFHRESRKSYQASRIAKLRAQCDVVMAIGRGYVRVPVAAPEGYFWKQDPGALDGVGSRCWRLYREPVKGV